MTADLALVAHQRPRLIVPPQPRPRYPKPSRKIHGAQKMTITLGILANDGIVLAADTEVSWGDTRKTEGTKIALWPEEGLAIAGAGNVDYIAALSERVHAAVLGVKTADMGLIRRKIQHALVNFHRDHILPWNDPSLDVWLFIALQRKEARVLWVTSKATMRPIVCAALGAGSAEADALLAQFFGRAKKPSLNLVTARLMAAYITYVAKDRVPGCGKNTDVVLIADGIAEQLSRSDVNNLEGTVDDFLELQTRAAQLAFGYIPVDDEAESAKHLADFFLSFRRRYQKTADSRGMSARWTLGKLPGQDESIEGPAFMPKDSQKRKASRPTPRRTKRDR